MVAEDIISAWDRMLRRLLPLSHVFYCPFLVSRRVRKTCTALAAHGTTNNGSPAVQGWTHGSG